MNQYYNAEITSLEIKLNKKNKHQIIYSISRLIVFILSIYFLITYIFFDGGINTLFLFCISLLSYIFIYKLHDKSLNEIYFIKSLLKVYKLEIKAKNGDYTNFNSGEIFINKEHPYSYDLDIFGTKSLYQRINRTFTDLGQKKLAGKLTDLNNTKEKLFKSQEAIEELTHKKNFVFTFLALGDKLIGFNYQSIKSLVSNKSIRTIFSSKLFLYASVFTLFFTYISLLLSYYTILPPIIPFCLLLSQFIFSTLFFKTLAIKKNVASKLYKHIKYYKSLLKHLNSNKFDAAILKEYSNELFKSSNSIKAFKELETILNKIDQRENVTVMFLFNTLYMRDLFIIREYEIWKEKYLQNIQLWIDRISEMEVLISFSIFRMNYPEYVYPSFLDIDKEILIDAKSMGHPFLNKKKLVTNDFKLFKNNFSIVTGANMAGKSTYLRAIGINYVLALNGMPVCAEYMKISILKIFSSMRTTDDINSGTSYFNAELRRIKSMITYIKTNEYTFILLDEILKGTNSQDKLKGSLLFLRKIYTHNVAGIIATHDLELSILEKEYPKNFCNYCFDVDIQNESQFTYKLSKGVAKNMNATYLLNKTLSEIL